MSNKSRKVCIDDLCSKNISKFSKSLCNFHYELERRLTVRETARLQSFPDEFVFPHATSKNFMEIGNAVPPIIGHAVMCQIAEFMRVNGI